MIKAIILDVDGVLVGSKPGFNFPDPNTQVTAALNQIRAKGIFISLCTGKPYFAIEKIIKDCQLDNIHITEGGAVIINPLQKNVFQRHLIDSEVATNLVRALLSRRIYTEVYNSQDYLIQKSQSCLDIQEKHFYILGREPLVADDLALASKTAEISKIMPIVANQNEKDIVEEVFANFQDKLDLQWATHPTALPLQFGVITTKGVTKRQGALDISEGLGVSLENTLGVGDSLMDWEFIEICGYGAAMGNTSQELKDLIKTKPAERFYIGPSVDDNGILDIFQHFNLI
jgi:HAD superfamily hydrolase (TIGR01484 family)